jgi:hypothetical protein
MRPANMGGEANMDKRILEIVNDFAAWRGNSFTLATLVAEKQREIDVEEFCPPEPEPPVEE